MKKLIYTLLSIILTMIPFQILAVPSKLPKYPYKIEYYYDNTLDSKETITSSGTMGDLVTNYPNKEKKGYELFYSTIDDEALTISDNPDFNIIKVFYTQINTENGYEKAPKTGIEQKGANIILPLALIVGLLFAKEKMKH